MRMRSFLYGIVAACAALLFTACSGIAPTLPVEQALACAQVELNPVNGGASNAVSATYSSHEARDTCLGNQGGGGPDGDSDDT